MKDKYNSEIEGMWDFYSELLLGERERESRII